MKNVLTNYGISQDTMVVYCDNSSAIDISKNPIQHSNTKHIEIRYHFIRDLVERKIVCLKYIPTECQMSTSSPNLLIEVSLKLFVK